MESNVPKEIFVLYCIGDEAFFDSKFKAMCSVAFEEDPVNNPKYKEVVDKFLDSCKDEAKISCVVEGTEKLTSIKLTLI